MIVHQAYRFALDPTPAQARALSAHCGAARFAFDWGLALVKAVLDQREAEASHGIAPEQLTPEPQWSLRSGLDSLAPAKPHAVVGVTHLAVLSPPLPGVADQAGLVANPPHLGCAPTALRRRSRTVSRRRGTDRTSSARSWSKTCTSPEGFGEVRRQLAYQTRWRGSRLLVADRWFPSSKTRSDCGVVKAELSRRARGEKAQQVPEAGDDETFTLHWTKDVSRDRSVRHNGVMPWRCDPDMVCR